MTRRHQLVASALALAVVLSACRVERPPYGGGKESALATATLAVDVDAVTRILKSGADPNKMVAVNGSQQSPWFLALYLLRKNRADMVQMINAMLKAGANPNVAWGTMTDVKAPQESVWHRFMNHARTAGSGSNSPLDLVVMFNPVPDVVRALMAAGASPRSGGTALVSAVEGGEPEIVHILVDAGVDVNARPSANTPLLSAIEARDVGVMTYLEEHGAREKP